MRLVEVSCALRSMRSNEQIDLPADTEWRIFGLLVRPNALYASRSHEPAPRGDLAERLGDLRVYISTRYNDFQVLPLMDAYRQWERAEDASGAATAFGALEGAKRAILALHADPTAPAALEVAWALDKATYSYHRWCAAVWPKLALMARGHESLRFGRILPPGDADPLELLLNLEVRREAP